MPRCARILQGTFLRSPLRGVLSWLMHKNPPVQWTVSTFFLFSFFFVMLVPCLAWKITLPLMSTADFGCLSHLLF